MFLFNKQCINKVQVDISMETFDVLFDLLSDTSGFLDEAWGNDCLTLILDLLMVASAELQRHVLKCISRVCAPQLALMGDINFNAVV